MKRNLLSITAGLSGVPGSSPHGNKLLIAVLLPMACQESCYVC